MCKWWVETEGLDFMESHIPMPTIPLSCWSLIGIPPMNKKMWLEKRVKSTMRQWHQRHMCFACES